MSVGLFWISFNDEDLAYSLNHLITAWDFLKKEGIYNEYYSAFTQTTDTNDKLMMLKNLRSSGFHDVQICLAVLKTFKDYYDFNARIISLWVELQKKGIFEENRELILKHLKNADMIASALLILKENDLYTDNKKFVSDFQFNDQSNINLTSVVEAWKDLKKEGLYEQHRDTVITSLAKETADMLIELNKNDLYTNGNWELLSPLLKKDVLFYDNTRWRDIIKGWASLKKAGLYEENRLLMASCERPSIIADSLIALKNTNLYFSLERQLIIASPINTVKAWSILKEVSDTFYRENFKDVIDSGNWYNEKAITRAQQLVALKKAGLYNDATRQQVLASSLDSEAVDCWIKLAQAGLSNTHRKMLSDSCYRYNILNGLIELKKLSLHEDAKACQLLFKHPYYASDVVVILTQIKDDPCYSEYLDLISQDYQNANKFIQAINLLKANNIYSELTRKTIMAWFSLAYSIAKELVGLHKKNRLQENIKLISEENRFYDLATALHILPDVLYNQTRQIILSNASNAYSLSLSIKKLCEAGIYEENKNIILSNAKYIHFFAESLLELNNNGLYNQANRGTILNLLQQTEDVKSFKENDANKILSAWIALKHHNIYEENRELILTYSNIADKLAKILIYLKQNNIYNEGKFIVLSHLDKIDDIEILFDSIDYPLGLYSLKNVFQNIPVPIQLLCLQIIKLDKDITLEVLAENLKQFPSIEVQKRLLELIHFNENQIHSDFFWSLFNKLPSTLHSTLLNNLSTIQLSVLTQEAIDEFKQGNRCKISNLIRILDPQQPAQLIALKHLFHRAPQLFYMKEIKVIEKLITTKDELLKLALVISPDQLKELLNSLGPNWLQQVIKDKETLIYVLQRLEVIKLHDGHSPSYTVFVEKIGEHLKHLILNEGDLNTLFTSLFFGKIRAFIESAPLSFLRSFFKNDLNQAGQYIYQTYGKTPSYAAWLFVLIHLRYMERSKNPHPYTHIQHSVFHPQSCNKKRELAALKELQKLIIKKEMNFTLTDISSEHRRTLTDLGILKEILPGLKNG